mgnify:CR=1 FL=1
MDESINADLDDKNSEAYRHECEIASVVRMYRERGGDAVKSYILQVEKHRGSNAAARLREEALAQVRLAEVDKRQQR